MQANPVAPTGPPSASGSPFAPGHLGELAELVPPELVDASLEDARAVQRRVRGLPSRVVVYLLLATCLFPGVGFAGVWRKLTASLPGREPRCF